MFASVLSSASGKLVSFLRHKNDDITNRTRTGRQLRDRCVYIEFYRQKWQLIACNEQKSKVFTLAVLLVLHDPYDHGVDAHLLITVAEPTVDANPCPERVHFSLKFMKPSEFQNMFIA